jgi:hypothetical protein
MPSSKTFAAVEYISRCYKHVFAWSIAHTNCLKPVRPLYLLPAGDKTADIALEQKDRRQSQKNEEAAAVGHGSNHHAGAHCGVPTKAR